VGGVPGCPKGLLFKDVSTLASLLDVQKALCDGAF
jgi:hypothetical protein